MDATTTRQVVEMMDTMEDILEKFKHVIGSVDKSDTDMITAIDTAEHYQMETLCAMMSVMDLNLHRFDSVASS